MDDTSPKPPKPPRHKKPRVHTEKAGQQPNENGDSSLDPDKQPYDNLLKRLVAHQYKDIIRLLLRDSTITEIELINVEMLLPIQRGDLIFRVRYLGEWHLLHFEFETSPNGTMDRRLHFYSAFLWYEYNLPIISFLFYPFKDSNVHPPMRMRSKQKVYDTFDYEIVRTWDMDAQEWISNPQAVPFYGLLPTMENLTKELLLEGIDRMIQFYQDDQQLLREELLCFKVMLQRAQRLSDTDIETVLRRIHMYDPLLEEDPWVKSLQEKSLAKGLAEGQAKGLAEGEAKGLAKGEAKGELRTARNFVTNAVRRRFPDLAILAEVRVLQLEQPDDLQQLLYQILEATDENAARVILETYPHK